MAEPDEETEVTELRAKVAELEAELETERATNRCRCGFVGCLECDERLGRNRPPVHRIRW